MNKLSKKNFSEWTRPILLAVALIFFVVRAIQMITEVSTQLAFPGATLYLLDYNFYIGSRTFIGSILTLLTPHITYQQIFAMNLSVFAVTVTVFFVLVCYTAKKAMREKNDFLFFVAILAIVCPYSVLQYANWVSAYDIYLCLFCMLCCVAASSKYMHWLSPILCIMAIFTHYAFVFSFFPTVLAVQIYNIIINEKKTSRIVSTIICFVSSFVCAVYCGFFANLTVKMTRDELYAYMSERLGAEVTNRHYFDSYYFEEDVYGMLSSLKNFIINAEFTKNFILFFAPVMFLFAILWCYYIMKNEKKQMFLGVFFLFTMAVSISLIFLIIEAPRWKTAAIISQFLILLLLIKKDDSIIIGCFDKLNKRLINGAMLIFIIYNIIASIVIKPYVV